MVVEIKPSPRLVEYVCSLEVEHMPENLQKLKTDVGNIRNSDLKWLEANTKKQSPRVYIHELLKGSEIILPSLPPPPPRNPELVARLERLKAEQAQKEYNRMTSNITRTADPSLNIGQELKQINSQILELFQFALSLVAAFAFGFFGVHWLIGPFEFGTRALIGIFVTVVVGIAELYFLVRIIGESDSSKLTKKVQ